MVFKQFCSTLCQLSDIVEKLTDIEQKQIQAASARQHKQIQVLLNDKQAALLSLRGLEHKRLQQAEALGFKGLTFQQIMDTADEGQKKLLAPIFTELTQKVSLLKEVHKDADRIIGVRIHEFEQMITLAGGSVQGTTSHLFRDKKI